nr:hypothetical protein [Tanacetum cinerariifolium]
HPLSPAYIPDPIELDEHAPVYALEPQHLEYHAPSDDDIQVEDDDDDPEEDPKDMPLWMIFALTGPPPGCDVAESLVAAAVRAPRSQYDFVDTVEAFEHRMMTSIEEVNLRVSYQAQRTAYETELQEVHQAYLSSEAQNRELLARLETLETYMSRIEWKRQSAEDLAVIQMMRIHKLEARARADTVEDTDSGC